jgi:ABC-2 type transport system permease protein
MSWTLFAKELKQQRTAFIIWTLSLIALILMTVALMPTMFESNEFLKNYLNMFPQEFLRAFSINASSFDDPLGFYVVYGSLYIFLLGGAYAISVSAGILLKEQSHGTAEFLLAKPLRRSTIFLSKAAVFITIILALNAAAYVSGWIGLKAFSQRPFSMASFTVISIYGVLLMLGLGGIGLLLSLLVRRARSFTGQAVGIVLGFYLIDALAKMTTKYDALGWISPFKWVDLDVTRAGYSFEWWRVAAFAVLIFSTFCASALVYRRKDILV